MREREQRVGHRRPVRRLEVQAAAEQMETLRESVARSLRLILFLSIPSSVGLVLLAVPSFTTLYRAWLGSSAQAGVLDEALIVPPTRPLLPTVTAVPAES